jgi:hypothetical protein
VCTSSYESVQASNAFESCLAMSHSINRIGLRIQSCSIETHQHGQLTTHTSFSLNSPDEISWAFDIRFDRHYLVCGEVVKW